MSIRVRCRVAGCNDRDTYPNVEAAEKDGWTVALNPTGDGPPDICPDHTEQEMNGDDPDLLVPDYPDGSVDEDDDDPDAGDDEYPDGSIEEEE